MTPELLRLALTHAANDLYERGPHRDHAADKEAALARNHAARAAL